MLRLAVARMASLPVADGAMPGWLGGSERRRWAGLPPAARGAFVTSRALLRDLLQEATGVPRAAWEVSADAGSAPRAWADGQGGEVRVSLSHRLGWVAAAVAHAEVGIDIEVDRRARSDPAERAALMLAPGELALWSAEADGDREAALLARWTAKEAWFKARSPRIAPWDFRRVHAGPAVAADARANVRTWRASPVHLALCCGDADALAQARCAGLPAVVDDAFWRVAAVDGSP